MGVRQEEELAGAVGAVVSTYLTNYGIVEALATSFDFEFVFFWQPSIHLADYEPIDEELAILQRADPAMTALASAVYEEIEGLSPSYEHLYYVSGKLLNGTSSGVWVDRMHLTPEGNQLATHYIVEVLEPILRRASPTSME